VGRVIIELGDDGSIKSMGGVVNGLEDFRKQMGKLRDLLGMEEGNKEVEKMRECSEAALAAQKARKILKEEFPGTKFRVRCHNNTLSSSVYVSWIDGPCERRVEQALSCLCAGYFDGMQDLYVYHRDRERPTVEYVFCDRSYSEGVVSRTIRELRDRYEELRRVESSDLSCNFMFRGVWRNWEQVVKSELLEKDL